jgi:hypothetical protein
MLTAGEVLGTYFLETRCQLLEIGAMLDRLDRASSGGLPGDPSADQRLVKIYQSLQLLAERKTTPDRAERLLNLFSDPV